MTLSALTDTALTIVGVFLFVLAAFVLAALLFGVAGVLSIFFLIVWAACCYGALAMVWRPTHAQQ